MDRVKYFKVVIDEKFSWKSYVSTLYKNLRNNNYQAVLLLERNYSITNLYFLHIYSRINYAIENWWGTENEILNPLKLNQNHFARTISNKPRRESALPTYFLATQNFICV